MRTTISFSIPTRDAQRTKKLAQQRGFPSLSEYLRFLMAQDDTDLITEDELLRLSQEANQLYREGKLIEAKSMADLPR